MTVFEVNKSFRSLEELLAGYRDLVFDHSLPLVQAWKSRHPAAGAVGCFPVYNPVEIIRAAGMLPVALLGAGNRVEITHADARFQSFICSIVKSTLELGLTGELRALDGIFFQNICDAARNLASVFHRNFPSMLVEYLHLPQNLTSPSAVDYLAAEFRRIQDRLEVLADRAITERDLRRSIALSNEVRALLRALDQLRCRCPQCLTAGELYILTRATTQLPPEESLPLLHAALGLVGRRHRRITDRLRVVVEGAFCEQPPLEFVEGLEEAGCYILNDDFHQGWKWFNADVPLDDSPLRALARSFVEDSVHCSVKHDARESLAAHLLQKVEATGAEAVILLAAKFCEPALLDYPILRRALDDAGIPHLFLEFEEKMWLFDQARTEVETFVESLLLD